MDCLPISGFVQPLGAMKYIDGIAIMLESKNVNI